MKHSVTLICMLISAAVSAQSEKEIKASISNVTVFPDRAQVFHSARTDIPAGKTVLKLTGLSPYIDAQSVQVKGQGEFTIISVNQQNNYLQNLGNAPQVENMRNQIEELKAKVEDEKAAINVLKEKEAFLIANRSVLVKETTFSIEQFKSLMDLYSNNMNEVTTSVLKKGRLIKDYEEQIANLQKQINDRMGRQQLPAGEIAVTVTAEKPIPGILNISYVVGNAGWYPSYDIRVDDISKPVTIIYKANVQQNTGVAWKDVKLTFSNATPWVSGNVPEQFPWMIDFYVPLPPRPPFSPKLSSQDRNAVPAQKMEIAQETTVGYAAASQVAVEKRTGETTILFEVAVPTNVPSDGRYQTIEIQRTSTPAEYRYVTVPKLSSLAYLTANITNWAEQSLQTGEATLYFENSFVGKSSIDASRPEDTLALSLGIDNSILVKREKRKDFTSHKTIGSNKTDLYSYLITVRNNKKTPVKITVKDQVPVSSNSDITVELQDLSGGKLESATGFVKWDLDLKPGDSKELILTYSVKYPKNKIVILE